MANHKNDHNHEMTTTVAVRAEVDRALASAVPQGRQRKEVVERVEQIIERYSSPYPDPKYLEQIEKLAPGATKEIIVCTIEELRHRQKMESEANELKREEIALVKDIAKGERDSTTQGRWIGFAAYLVCFAFSAAIYALGSETLASLSFGAAVLGIIGQLIRGGSRSVVLKTEEVDEADEPKKLPSK